MSNYEKLTILLTLVQIWLSVIALWLANLGEE
jgi:hypothetical protein